MNTAPTIRQQPTISAAARSAAADDESQLAGCLARSFENDPVLCWLLPDARTRRHRATAFYSAVLRRFRGLGEISTTPGRDAAAIWQPPKAAQSSLLAELGYTLRMLGILRAQSLRARRLLVAMERVHYRAPHWYLAILGTEPRSRGMGLASALLEPILLRCDREALPAYLESSNEANLPFYRRHGFEVVSRVSVTDGPTLWPMLRQPLPHRTSASAGRLRPPGESKPVSSA